MATQTRRLEDRLRLELEKTLPQLDFDPQLNLRYREMIRADRRLVRSLYYLVPAVLFGLVAYAGLGHQSGVADLSALVGRMEVGLFLPALLFAVVANSGRLQQAASSSLQHTATAALWSGILALQCFAQVRGAYFPPEVLSAALLGGALVCGFRLRPMLIGIALFTALDLLCIWGGGPSTERALLDTLTVATLGCCAMGGASLVEASRRRLWIAGQVADVAARNDPLTGLATRAEFNLRFPLVVAQARREQKPVTLMVLSIDGFRAINEKFDHLYGDLVLRAVAAQLQQYGRRPMDLRARFSGGKLAVVWYNAVPEMVAEFAQELLKGVRAVELERPPYGVAPRLSLSIGALCLVPDERSSPSELVRSADSLMYRARNDGGDRLLLQRKAGDAPGEVTALGVVATSP
ncbi:MAG: GGDEF domain-containing protein [Nevskia sp.]|nr:GGDEF domain-containing protein [Nevskia sp.]